MTPQTRRRGKLKPARDIQSAPELLRVIDIAAICNLSREQLHRRIARGDFPKPFYLAPKCPRWRRATIEAWLSELEAAA